MGSARRSRRGSPRSKNDATDFRGTRLGPDRLRPSSSPRRTVRIAAGKRPANSVMLNKADLIDGGETMLRARMTVAALLGGLAMAAALPGLALGAAPTVTFKAKALPIPKPGGGTYSHTGDILGAGTAFQAEFSIEGSGYGATPQRPQGGIPPLSSVNFYSPAGVKLNYAPFGTCTEAVLQNTGPSGCPKSSVA